MLKNKNHNKDKHRVKEVISFVKDHGGLEYAIAKMKEFRDQALKIIEPYPNSEFKKSLELMVEYVIDRKK